MGNIEPEDRKVPISIGLSAKTWKKIDKFIHDNGSMSRSQFVETVSEWYIDEREKSPNSNHKGIFTSRQIANCFEDLEGYFRLSEIDEMRKVLPFVRRANQLAENLTRRVKRDISKITDRDPTERIRLENTRRAHEYREQHEKATVESEEPEPNIEAEELELKRLAESIGNEISERFGTKEEEQEKPDIDIIEEEAPNPYSKGESVFR
jgi:hypothetical protein